MPGTTDPAERQKFHDRLTRGRWWKAKEGRSPVRVMPPAGGCNRWWHEWTLHWTVGRLRAVVPCTRQHGGGKCAVCEDNERLLAIGDADGINTVNRRGAQWHVMVNIVDLGTPEVGVQKMLCGRQIMEGLMGYDVDPEYGDIVDPDKGFDMYIVRGPKDSQPLYTVRSAREPTAVKDRAWLSELDDLSEAFQIYTYEEQQRLLKGESVPRRRPDSEAAQPADTTEAPAAPAPVPAAAAAAAPVPADRPRTRCFGNYVAGDAICERCEEKVGCQQATPGGGAPEPPRTRCFGKMYDPQSPDCSACESAVDCAAALLGKKA